MDINKKFLYINPSASNEDNARMFPVSSLRAFHMTDTDDMNISFDDAGNPDHTIAAVRITDGLTKTVMREFVEAINFSKDAVIVLADQSDDSSVSANIDFAGTISFTEGAEGASTLSALTVSGATLLDGDVTLGDAQADKVEIAGKLVQGNITQTDIDTQSHTLLAAQFLTGVFVHTSVTGAGEITFDTAANLISALELEANNEVAKCLYINDGNQNVTLNGGTPSGVTYVNNPTIAAEGAATLVVRRTGSAAVAVYIV